jgi:PAS domain S-box-containing protein
MTRRDPEPSDDDTPMMHAWQRLHFALSAAGIGTWHLDLRTGIATYDESLNRIFGLPAVETQTPLDERLTSIHAADRPAVRAAIDDAIARRSEFSLEFRVVRPDGVVRWLRDRGRIVLDDDGTPVAATGAVMDVTERREQEEHNEALLRELERANRVKDEFLATLSHELRTPLNAVLGWTRMLRRGAVSPDRTPSILETIERNASAQMQLVEELLDLSAMAAGGLRLSITRVNLKEVISGAVETVRPAAEAKTLALSVTVSDRLDEIAGDPARLRQVLWNLLANAVKFTPAGGAIDVRVADGPSDVEIIVTDSGPGIPPDFLPHVFEPFRQGDDSATRTVGGLGLGLAIVRHIVEAHGGVVTAHSDGDGRGATFVVRLPTGRVPRNAETRSGAGSLRGRRVLAVDDDESMQELVATMLLMYGVSVRTAGRASDAMHILSEWRPDVLLTDIAMPGEDGYGLMRRVRALPGSAGAIPAVALTAFTDSHSVQNAFAAGFDAHLGKPLEPHVLADALAKVLRVRR